MNTKDDVPMLLYSIVDVFFISIYIYSGDIGLFSNELLTYMCVCVSERMCVCECVSTCLIGENLCTRKNNRTVQ